MGVCPTAFDADFLASIRLALVAPGAGGLVVAIGLAHQAVQACDSGVPGTVALCAPIQAKSLGEVLEILFFGSCSSGASLWGYRCLWSIFHIKGLSYVIGHSALIRGWKSKGYAIPISGVSRHPVSVRFIHYIPQFVKRFCKRGF